MNIGPIEIFRTGSFTAMSGTKVTIKDGDLASIQSSYDPVAAPAPAVIGHPKIDAPAYAWVESLAITGGKLTAILKDAAPEFVAWVKAGHYRKVSISLYMPGDTSNPAPDQLYLKHIGFLGAAAPAVPGLAPIGFSENETSTALTFADDRVERERDELRRRLDEMELETLFDQGRVLPVWKGQLLEFMSGLDKDATISFSDGSSKSQSEWFWDYLKAAPVVVDFSALPRGTGPDKPKNVGKTPMGYVVDQGGAALFDQISTIAALEGITFEEAARRLPEYT